MRSPTLDEKIGLALERRERPFHVTASVDKEILAESVSHATARVVPLNEAAERLNDALTMQARIEALEAERRWMPFEKPEQLPQTMWAPNYSDPILVAILSGKTRFVRDDRYDFVQDRWDSGCVGVTHWMPLPEPPEAEK